MKWTTAALLALVAVLAGCSGPSANPKYTTGGTGQEVAPTTMTILGLVQDASFAPVEGADVALRFTAHAAKTDAKGEFRFDGLAPSAYLVDVAAAGFENASLTAEPGRSSLNFVLEIAASLKPTHTTVQFHGFLECAFEAVIISPSCDSAVSDPPVSAVPPVFNDTSQFFVDLQGGWSTLVIDVDFDPAASPGLDGLRLSVRGRSDDQALGTYEQYGRFYAPESFTARLDPGQTYEEGVGPVPNNATALELDIYPQSHLWHAGGVSPFLGVGAAMNVEFDVYVTAFYNEAAPEGWSVLQA